MYLDDRPAEKVGYAALVVAGLLVSGSAIHWGISQSLTTPIDALGVVFPLLWTGFVWSIGYWHRRRGTTGRDVAVVAGWVVGMGVNFGLLLWVIFEHQQFVGVDIAEPGIIIIGVTGAGMFNGLLIGTFHVFAREKARTIDRERRTLRRRTEQLEFLNRLMRHDIRNDVAVIQGYAQLLADGGANGRVERILRKSHHIEELTDLAQEVNETLGDKTRQEIDLSASLAEAIDQARTAYPEAEFEVDADLPADLPVVANRLLGSVFENLLGNAVEHSGAQTPRVEIGATVGTDTVSVRIADNGPGISDLRKRTLFRAGEKRSDSTGMGLGLYLVKTLVANYGGDVWVEDNEPHGSVFVVVLERADAPALEAVGKSEV